MRFVQFLFFRHALVYIKMQVEFGIKTDLDHLFLEYLILASIYLRLSLLDYMESCSPQSKNHPGGGSVDKN